MKRKHNNITIIPYAAWGLIAVMLILSLAAAKVFAYLKQSAGKAENTFLSEQSVTPQINETFNGNEKSNVSVFVGDAGYSVYVRAAVIITWKDSSGNVLAETPSLLRQDYEISYNLKEGGWFYGNDGFYYYSIPVESGSSTDTLINNCKPLSGAPENGYSLDVEIIAQTIQSAGFSDAGDVPAVTEAWGVAVNKDKSLIPNN